MAPPKFPQPPTLPGHVSKEPGRPMAFQPGDIVRFTYDHQDRDDATGPEQKSAVLILNPMWNNKRHGIDLERLSPLQRDILEALLDPTQQSKPHRLPLVNQLRKRMNPIEMITNPVAFYTKFLKPFLRGTDAYRQYIPTRMHGITKVRDMTITGKRKLSDIPTPFGPGQKPPEPPAPKPLTPIDVMKQNTANKGSPKK